MICAGIDAGSRAIKVALFDTESSKVLMTGIADQGLEQEARATELFERALRDCALERAQVGAVAATGYGRNQVRFAEVTITEITCHACGVRHFTPAARTIIEMGGQDSKLIRLDAEGRVRDFTMNDRCAAGTGRFLEMAAARLGLDLAGLDHCSRGSGSPAQISSTCVIFAETEMIGLMAQGAAAPDIAAGVQSAIASRVAAMAGRALDPPVYFTGGVALNTGMTRALAEALGHEVRVPPLPQYTGAVGAAILAAERNGR